MEPSKDGFCHKRNRTMFERLVYNIVLTKRGYQAETSPRGKFGVVYSTLHGDLVWPTVLNFALSPLRHVGNFACLWFRGQVLVNFSSKSQSVRHQTESETQTFILKTICNRCIRLQLHCVAAMVEVVVSKRNQRKSGSALLIGGGYTKECVRSTKTKKVVVKGPSVLCYRPTISNQMER